MKKWTVVLEITDNHDLWGEDDRPMNQKEIENMISEKLSGHLPPDVSFQIMETIEAPYGPELLGGVYLDVREGPKKVRR